MNFKSSIRYGLLLAVLLTIGKAGFSQTAAAATSGAVAAVMPFTITISEPEGSDVTCGCPPNNSLITLLGNTFLCDNTQSPFTATHNCADENTFTWTWTAESNCQIISSSGNTAVIAPTVSSGNASFRVGATKAGCTFSKSKKFTLPVYSASSCSH